MEIAILEILLRDNLRAKGNLYFMMGVGITDNSKMGLFMDKENTGDMINLLKPMIYEKVSFPWDSL